MPGQHTEVAADARNLDLVDLVVDDAPVRRDDLQLELRWYFVVATATYCFIFSAFSTASSIVPTM